MKKLLVILAMVLLPTLVWSAPFLVCTPDNTTNKPTHYAVVMDGGAEVLSPAQTVAGGVRLHYDLVGLTAGSHTVSVKAVLIDAVWGRLESTAVPFSFGKPASPITPGGIVLSQD